MPIDDPIRGEAMGRRVVRTAHALGVDPAGLEVIGTAYRAAVRPREELLDDDHDPHYLHPGRTALILMLDTGESDPAVLAAAVLAESQRPELMAAEGAVQAAWQGRRLSRPSGPSGTSGESGPSGPSEPSGPPGPSGAESAPARRALGAALERALDLRSRLPGRDDPDLVETLVVAEPALGLVAVAERLDHARHAHMWHEGAGDDRLLDEFEETWGALAERVHPRLGQRFRRWARGTRRRLGR